MLEKRDAYQDPTTQTRCRLKTFSGLGNLYAYVTQPFRVYFICDKWY